MEKINFENYPSTDSPINADNLNLMQNNIETTINGAEESLENLIGDLDNLETTAKDNLVNSTNELKSGLDALFDKSIGSLSVSVGASLSASSWQAVGSDLSATLERGTYLFIYCLTLQTTSTTSVATIQPYVDGLTVTSNRRSSIPMSTNLLTTAQSVFLQTFSEDATHTFNIYVYPNGTVTVSSGGIYYIKLN